MTPFEAFQILQLPVTASEDEVRAKYRARALELHPDTTKKARHKDGKAFVVLKNAYKIAIKVVRTEIPVPPPPPKPRILSISRIVPRDRVFRRGGKWSVLLGVPRLFARHGGEIHVIGCDNDDPEDMSGLLLPEFFLYVPKFEQEPSQMYAMTVKNLNPPVAFYIKINDALQH